MIKFLKEKLKHRKSVSDNITYPAFCLEASKDEKVFMDFRSNDIYKNILEHVDFEIAVQYFEIIKMKYGLTEFEIFDKIKKLNLIGKPELIKVSSNIPELSSTGLRYLFTGLEIKEFVEKNSLNTDHIIELGCGYGGQSLILDDLLQIKKYTYIDLPEVNSLIKKFLSNFTTSFDTVYETINTAIQENYTLFISNYSFSELPKNLQNKVIKKFIKNSYSGYMIINSENFSLKYRFLTKEDYRSLFHNYEIKKEIPQTSVKDVNFVYTYIND
jgi:hypothetical protein